MPITQHYIAITVDIPEAGRIAFEQLNDKPNNWIVKSLLTVLQ
jgi:hypothetical protein